MKGYHKAVLNYILKKKNDQVLKWNTHYEHSPVRKMLHREKYWKDERTQANVLMKMAVFCMGNYFSFLGLYVLSNFSYNKQVVLIKGGNLIFCYKIVSTWFRSFLYYMHWENVKQHINFFMQHLAYENRNWEVEFEICIHVCMSTFTQEARLRRVRTTRVGQRCHGEPCKLPPPAMGMPCTAKRHQACQANTAAPRPPLPARLQPPSPY